MHVLYVCVYLQLLINGTRAIFQIQFMQVSEVIISTRGYGPLLFARSFNIHTKTGTMTVLLCAFGYRSSSSVCWVVGHSG